MPGFSLIRPKNKPSECNKNTVDSRDPEKKEEVTTKIEENSTPYTEPSDTNTKEKKIDPQIEKKQNEPEISKPTTELENYAYDEMKTISSRPKERINCENCEKTFATPMFMYDYTEGRRMLVGCCPYCDHIIGKPPNKKRVETENCVASEIEKAKRLLENAKKRDPMIFQINSEELEELIRNTAYVR